MRLIDADALKEQREAICKGCEHYNYMRCASCNMNTAIAQLENAPTIGGWIRVKDRLPEESCVVLAYHDYGVMQVLDYSKKHRLFNCHDWNNKREAEEVVIRSVTHGQQLPEPPKE